MVNFTHNNIGEYMKLKIKYLEKNKNTNLTSNKNFIGIYLLGIRVKKIYIQKKVHNNNNNKNINTIYMTIKKIINSKKGLIKILKSIKLKKLNMKLGINFDDPILNAYSIVLINSILPLYIANTTKNYNPNNFYYNTFISKKVIYLDINCIISIPIAKNIFSIIEIILKNMKGGKKNGNKASN